MIDFRICCVGRQNVIPVYRRAGALRQNGIRNVIPLQTVPGDGQPVFFAIGAYVDSGKLVVIARVVAVGSIGLQGNMSDAVYLL